ncbi:hypothetical protein P691DRAFT_794472 [Macrolepiota fuliginosa MF-IS2]|uniref:PIN domain-containing protein n=1 Tax=Macrolepiota fuliginosa MF-IS2 TaxID=1400762 RepID=A0A9P6C282_9AGAR|nr:hypothetical protein P691DRAFT_794472 [Macrolepiota fuliginosa MF-IS2]
MNTMADRKIPSPSPNKMAMSRALGAAFLNHQVEQLEKSVSANSPSSGNWRDRKHVPTNQYNTPPQYATKHTPMAPGIKIVHRKKGGDAPSHASKKPVVRETPSNGPRVHDSAPVKVHGHGHGGDKGDKDADIIVVDASVLVHALYQVKKWCRDGRKEILIVPLEALNTLDLLKKGTSPLAQRARAASRILEAQVGTNPRIRVQRDDAFVLWDKIPMKEISSDDEAAPSPEWVRRTICCARWEFDNADVTMHSDGNGRPADSTTEKGNGSKKYKVAIAVLSGSPNLSPLNHGLKLADSNDSAMAPVPLPAPSIPHTNKFEARSSGTLVGKWAERAGVDSLPIEPTLPGRGAGAGGDEEERPKRVHHSHHAPKGRRSSNADHPHPHAHTHAPKACLVERPPAVMAMMEMVSQPTRVVRVLARGEKLEPGP